MAKSSETMVIEEVAEPTPDAMGNVEEAEDQISTTSRERSKDLAVLPPPIGRVCFEYGNASGVSRMELSQAVPATQKCAVSILRAATNGFVTETSFLVPSSPDVFIRRSKMFSAMKLHDNVKGSVKSLLPPPLGKVVAEEKTAEGHSRIEILPLVPPDKLPLVMTLRATSSGFVTETVFIATGTTLQSLERRVRTFDK